MEQAYKVWNAQQKLKTIYEIDNELNFVFEIHSVESEHQGNSHNSVLYIPAGPDCPINRDYLRRMRHTFVLSHSPPDFPVNNYEKDFKLKLQVHRFIPMEVIKKVNVVPDLESGVRMGKITDSS